MKKDLYLIKINREIEERKNYKSEGNPIDTIKYVAGTIAGLELAKKFIIGIDLASGQDRTAYAPPLKS